VQPCVSYSYFCNHINASQCEKLSLTFGIILLHIHWKQGNLSLKGFHSAQPILDDVPLTGQFGYLYSWYAFTAPEVDVNFIHDKSVDLWSLGSIIYMLLIGFPPFRGSGVDLIEKKHTGILEFDFVSVSRPAEELVRNLLQVQPKMRYTIDEVLNDRWMTESEEYLERFDLEVAHAGFADWRNVG